MLCSAKMRKKWNQRKYLYFATDSSHWIQEHFTFAPNLEYRFNWIFILSIWCIRHAWYCCCCCCCFYCRRILLFECDFFFIAINCIVEKKSSVVTMENLDKWHSNSPRTQWLSNVYDTVRIFPIHSLLSWFFFIYPKKHTYIICSDVY